MIQLPPRSRQSRSSAASDVYKSQDQDDDPFPFTELALAVSLEDFLNHQWGWNDLLAFASDDVMDKILWITIDAFLVIKNDERDYFDYDELGCFIEATVQES